MQLVISPIYHMREVGRNQHAPLWTEAIETRFEVGTPWRREEFDRILGEFEASRPLLHSL